MECNQLQRQELSACIRRIDAFARFTTRDAEELTRLKHQTIKTVRRMRSGVPETNDKQWHLPTIWRHCRDM